MGIRIAPIRKLRRVWNSIEVVRTSNPRGPERSVIIIIKNIRIIIEIFIYGILWMFLAIVFEIKIVIGIAIKEEIKIVMSIIVSSVF